MRTVVIRHLRPYSGILFTGRLVHLRGDDHPRRIVRIRAWSEMKGIWAMLYGRWGQDVPDEYRPLFEVEGLAGVYHRGHLQPDETLRAHPSTDVPISEYYP